MSELRQDAMLSRKKMCLYTVEWQKLRISFKGRWSQEAGAKANCHKLFTYISEPPATPYARVQIQMHDISRLYRALNLLNAVRMGFHCSGQVNMPADRVVVALRDIVQTNYKKLTHTLKKQGLSAEQIDEQFELPTVESVTRDWAVLSDGLQQVIIEDLQYRLLNAASQTSRPELVWFLSVVGGLPINVSTMNVGVQEDQS